MPACILLVVVGAILTLAAAPAHAVTTVSFAPDDEIDFATLYIEASGNERDDIVEEMRADWTTLRGRAGSARLKAGEGCVQRAPRVVRCEGYAQMVADLGGGDDRLEVSGPDGSEFLANVNGGPGNDSIRVADRVSATLSGGSGRDLLVGGRYADVLRGGPGRDRILGGGGADSLTGDGTRGGGPGDDVLVGGAGSDRAGWEERRTAVAVDLERGRGGGRGERDRLLSIENATTGAGRDRIFGNARANALDGGRGADLIDGRAGNDELGSSEDGVQDTLRCGAGNDVVTDALTTSVRGPVRGAEPLRPECERLASSDWVDLEGGVVAAHPRPAGSRAVRVQVVCFGDETACSRRVTLRVRGRVIGRSELADVSAARQPSVTVPLRRPLPRGATVSIVVDGVDGEGEEATPYVVGWRIRTR